MATTTKTTYYFYYDTTNKKMVKSTTAPTTAKKILTEQNVVDALFDAGLLTAISSTKPTNYAADSLASSGFKSNSANSKKTVAKQYVTTGNSSCLFTSVNE